MEMRIVMNDVEYVLDFVGTDIAHHLLHRQKRSHKIMRH